MSYFQFTKLEKTITLSTQSRISMLIPWKYNETVMILQNGQYIHYNLTSESIIKNGKLSICPSGYITYQNSNFIYFYNQNVILRLYLVFGREYQEEKCQVQLSSDSTQYFMVKDNIIQVISGLEFGITVLALDFEKKKWTQTISFGKHLLHYKLLDPKKSINDQQSFYLFANGDKQIFLHIIQIVINKNKNKLDIVLLKNIQLNQCQIMIGALFSSNYLYIISNSIPGGFSLTRYNPSIQSKPQKLVLQNQSQQDSKNLIIRTIIAIIDQQIICTIQKNNKQYLIKINLQQIIHKNNNIYQIQQIINLNRNSRYICCLNNSGLHYYNLICQQYLQKIQLSPTILKINLLLKIQKQYMYLKLIQQLDIDQFLSDSILSLL